MAAAFDVAYAVNPGRARTPMIEALTMIEPPPPSLSAGTPARKQRNTPFTLTASARSISSSVVSSTGCGGLL